MKWYVDCDGWGTVVEAETAQEAAEKFCRDEHFDITDDVINVEECSDD